MLGIFGAKTSWVVASLFIFAATITVTLIRHGLPALKEHWKRNVRDGAIITVAVWTGLLLVGLPRSAYRDHHALLAANDTLRAANAKLRTENVKLRSAQREVDTALRELRTQRANGAWLDLPAEPGGKTHRHPFPFIVHVKNVGALGAWYTVRRNCVELVTSEPEVFNCRGNLPSPSRWLAPFREQPIMERVDLLPADGDWHEDQMRKGEKNAYGYVEIEFRDSLDGPWMVEGCWSLQWKGEVYWIECDGHNGTRKKQ
jgi:hypothetical protein